MFETKQDPLLPKKQFFKRILRNLVTATVLLFFSLSIGILGYHYICGLGWIDSLLNASMILTGMGPIDPMKTDAAKIFASMYSIFSGVAFLTMVGVILAPAFHRFMHKFLIEDEEN